MKRFSFIIIVLVLMASIFMSCEQPTEPAPEPEVLNWMDVVPGGFWEITGIVDDAHITRTALDDGELVDDVYVVFNEDNTISLWFDHEPNGILEPEDLVSYAGSWALTDGVLFAFGREMTPIMDGTDKWYGQMNILDTIIGNFLVGEGYTVEGTRNYIFERRFPTYMDANDVISTNFSIVFDDMDDFEIYDGKRIVLPVVDCVDWAEFTWGDVGIILGNTRANGGKLWINDDVYPLFENDTKIFIKDDVYDIEILVQPNSVAYINATNRANGESYSRKLAIPYGEVGELTLIRVNDCDVIQ
jgi:hypothetical protein